MSSKVEIVNLALSSLGAKSTITDLDSDASVESRQASLHYEQALKKALTASYWSFATTWGTSALLSASPPKDWTYMYALPANCLRVLGVVNAAGRVKKPKPFQRASYNGQIVLLTDTESPVWRYVFFNEDATTYSPEFVDVVAAALAARLAMPLTRKRELAKEAAAAYKTAVAIASAADANENNQNGDPDYVPEWFQERGYNDGNTVYTTDADGDIVTIPGNL